MSRRHERRGRRRDGRSDASPGVDLERMAESQTKLSDPRINERHRALLARARLLTKTLAFRDRVEALLTMLHCGPYRVTETEVGSVIARPVNEVHRPETYPMGCTAKTWENDFWLRARLLRKDGYEVVLDEDKHGLFFRVRPPVR